VKFLPTNGDNLIRLIKLYFHPLSKGREQIEGVWEQGDEIIGSEMEEVTGDRRKFHNEELFYGQFSPGIIRVIESKGMRWTTCSMHWWIRNAQEDLVGKPEEKRQLRRLA